MPMNEESDNFIDHYMRPAAEAMRDVQALYNEAIAQWNGGINSLFAGEDAVVAGDQNAEHHPVTGADITNTMNRMMQVVDGGPGYESGGGLNGPNMMDAPLKLVVRTI